MAGHKQGVANQICDEEPIALYTQYYGHSLDLAVADTIKQCAVVSRAFDIVNEITKMVKKSSRRQTTLGKN